MILQILVENAIKHGIENIKGKARLTLKVVNTDRLLMVEVINPIANSTALPTHGTGTGLKNIKQRLYLLYGDLARLSVTSSEHSFTVSLVIPMET